ncbi:MAG: ATP-dependent zinc metalloprotease FtsH [candidate division KSB1 bacterium]|nr:ATP-dependent zinc metalloprotease FtsH [candidate division KSB1 bacterium]
MPQKRTGRPRKDPLSKRSPRRSPSEDPEDGFQWLRASRTLLFWIAIILGSVWVSQRLSMSQAREVTIPYSEFVRHLEAGEVVSAQVRGREFHGALKQPATITSRGRLETYQLFKVVLPQEPSHEQVLRWIHDFGLQVEFKGEARYFWGYIGYLLPVALIFAMWVILLRRMQGAGTKGIFTFGKSRAKLFLENRPPVTFDDVAGADEAKEELREIVEFLKNPERFQRLGGKIPKGALLTGPPGTGKTLLARAVAGEAGVPFFSISGADFVEMFVGVGASRVRDLFEQGKKHAPCIIFIDEIDAVGRQRGAGLGGGHDEREQTLNQLLVEMDGFDSNEGVILLAATNRPDVLDQALLRPGRFDRQIVVDRPDVLGREGILKVHTRNVPLGPDVDLRTLAKGTPGFVGADLANLVNEAALLAARKGKNVVEMEDFEEAKDKVLMGAERKSLLISEEEKRSTAYHEAGHALVAKLTPGADPVHKVTIIPRGRALGATTTLPMDERHNYPRSYCLAMLRQLMGGREAEKLVLNEVSTGAGNDIERATELARKMVCEWGMSEKVGPLAFGRQGDEVFIGRELALARPYSDSTAELIDQEIRRLVNEAAEEANRLLRENIDKLHRLAQALLEYEILDGEEIDRVLAGEPLSRVPSRRAPAGKADTAETAGKEPTVAPQPVLRPGRA